MRESWRSAWRTACHCQTRGAGSYPARSPRGDCKVFQRVGARRALPQRENEGGSYEIEWICPRFRAERAATAQRGKFQRGIGAKPRHRAAGNPSRAFFIGVQCLAPRGRESTRSAFLYPHPHGSSVDRDAKEINTVLRVASPNEGDEHAREKETHRA